MKIVTVWKMMMIEMGMHPQGRKAAREAHTHGRSGENLEECWEMGVLSVREGRRTGAIVTVSQETGSQANIRLGCALMFSYLGMSLLKAAFFS